MSGLKCNCYGTSQECGRSNSFLSISWLSKLKEERKALIVEHKYYLFLRWIFHGNNFFKKISNYDNLI